MTDEEISAHAQTIYTALDELETTGAPHALTGLHRALYVAFEHYIREHPGVVRPYDGTSKPPPP